VIGTEAAQGTKFSDDDYVRFDPFDGDRDVDVKCRRVKVVTVRRQHPCQIRGGIERKSHLIKPGERARYETALVDGQWGSYYVCLPCMDAWLAEFGP